ncbi:hypothetical protein ACFQ38_15610 [Sporosarcina contaminans]|uniref:Uncharacterized protein n=1 Tax=Sporosarcina contaminans TaxID=633403 RepID=A0ABW3U1K7_9BACL
MSGPSSKQLQAYPAIHKGRLSGAVSKMELPFDYLQIYKLLTVPPMSGSIFGKREQLAMEMRN